ncbi:hypothetical protein KHQ06_33655 [Nocardia tengchongensis]|uniref:Uncharacterized protein n=1 Tax=Nocardia tengchongensis TaxID=2055889 RepID=A0ABX8CPP0_9NOCA|nr:hypothetical protein [Nocardia tengchongensis]QVI20963.1 hypothetical protein KHQ06_33655 [Nocardia tengchongensis]
MGTVLLIALGLLCFVTGPALALVIVFAVRGSTRHVAAERRRGGGEPGPSGSARRSTGTWSGTGHP